MLHSSLFCTFFDIIYFNFYIKNCIETRNKTKIIIDDLYEAVGKVFKKSFFFTLVPGNRIKGKYA